AAVMASGSFVPRLLLVRVTVTPGTAADWASRTLPESVPVVSCAVARGIDIPSTSAMAKRVTPGIPCRLNRFGCMFTSRGLWLTLPQLGRVPDQTAPSVDLG